MADVLEVLNSTKLVLQQLQGCGITDPGTLEKIIQIRKFTCTEDNPPLAQIINSEICPLLIQQMDLSTQSNLIFEVLWILSNVASGNKLQTQYVISIGGIPTFLKYVSHQDEDVMAQALWGLGNIVGESTQFRDQVLNQNAVQIVLKQLDRKNLKIANQRTICWVISNFARGNPAPAYEIVNPCIPYFVKTMMSYQDDQEIWCDCMWGLNYLTTIDAGAEDFVNAGFLSVVCDKIKQHQNPSELSMTILSPLVRILANISTGSNSDTDALIQQGVLPVLVELIKHKKPAIQQEVLRTLSNIAAGTSQQLMFLIGCQNFYENLIETHKSMKGTQKIKNEVLYVLSNGFGKIEAITYFLEKGAVEFMFQQLKDYQNETGIRIIVEGLIELVSYVLASNIPADCLIGKHVYLKNIAKTIPVQSKAMFKKLFKQTVDYQKKQSTIESIAGQLDELKLSDDEEIDDEDDEDEEEEDGSEIDPEEEDDGVDDDDHGDGAGPGAGAAPLEQEDEEEEVSDDDDDDEEEEDDDDEEEEEEITIEIESGVGGAAPGAAPS